MNTNIINMFPPPPPPPPPLIYCFLKLYLSNLQILDKLGLKDEILPKLKDWMKKVVLPHYTSLVGENQRADGDNSISLNNLGTERWITCNETITTILNRAIENPEKVCRVVFNFNVLRTFLT